jgi:hypothetical protein
MSVSYSLYDRFVVFVRFRELTAAAVAAAAAATATATAAAVAQRVFMRASKTSQKARKHDRSGVDK